MHQHRGRSRVGCLAALENRMQRRTDYEGIDDSLSGTPPEPVNLHGHIDQDRVLTSSGESPTGGIALGGESDRIQPSEWARKHGSATNVLEDETPE